LLRGSRHVRHEARDRRVLGEVQNLSGRWSHSCDGAARRGPGPPRGPGSVPAVSARVWSWFDARNPAASPNRCEYL
jgi:hypothetical protein